MWLSSFPNHPFPTVYSWLLCHKLIDHMCMSLFLCSIFCSIDLLSVFMPDHRVLIPIALKCSLKSGRVMPPAFSFSKLLWLFRVFCGSVQFFSDVWSYLFVTLRTLHFWLDSRLTGQNSQRHQPPSLGNLFLAFCFGFLHSLGQRHSIFCSLFLIFLSTLFPQSNTPMCVLHNMWSNKTLNLGCFGPRFLTFFV